MDTPRDVYVSSLLNRLLPVNFTALTYCVKTDHTELDPEIDRVDRLSRSFEGGVESSRVERRALSRVDRSNRSVDS